MASSFVVITTDLRRVPVKVPAGGYMIDVLEDACGKLKLQSEAYQLKHGNKPINLTDPIRAAGLTQGAKLELVVKSKSPSAVTVALRLPDSEARLGLANNRVSAKVRSDTQLWKLLRQLEEGEAAKAKGLNITARGVPRTSHGGAGGSAGGGSGQLYWETPVLRFAGRELASLDDFGKTLSQVGIDTGSQLIMLAFRPSDVTLQAAMEAVQRQFQDDAAEGAAAAVSAVPAAPGAPGAPGAPAETTTAAAATAAATPAAAAPPAEAESSSKPAPPAPEPMDVDGSDADAHLRPVQVWSPPKATGAGGMPAAAGLRWAREEAGGGGGLAPTIAQMKAHQKHLEEAGRNRRLKSDAELAAETRAREARAAAVDKIDVRVRFPDGYTALWSFGNGATGATLHAAVRSVLADDLARQPFRLAPPMAREAILDRADAKHSLVRGYGMRGGGVMVHFLRGVDVPPPAPPGRPYLKPDVVARAGDIVLPQPIDDNDDEADEDDGPASAAAAAPVKEKLDKGEQLKKMSKFLRLAKK